MIISKDNLTMNLNIMFKLYITKKNLYLNKRSDHKNDDHNNQILSFKTLCFINECFLLFLLKWSLSHAILSMHIICLKSSML
jgi:hypothetical protein